MHVCIVGAGPTGLLTGVGLARRGHAVTVVDRDRGPDADGSWTRKGVMQFHHAHTFRGHVADVLRSVAPDAYDEWLELGAEPVPLSLEDGHEVVLGVRSQRSTFELALRRVAQRTPGVTLVQGHADAVVTAYGRAAGVRVENSPVSADWVIDASGRSSRLTRALRPDPAVGGPCGIAYVDRVYRLHEDAEPGPLVNPIAWGGSYPGYEILLFPHERGLFSVVFIRPDDDRGLALLRDAAAFDAAARLVPGLADWVDPDRAAPETPVLVGGKMKNYYRGQRGTDGAVALPGLTFLGDLVCTTTPNFGRGVTTSLWQVRRLLELHDSEGDDLVGLTEAFEAWSDEALLPWVEDHVRSDTCKRRRWVGEDLDLNDPLPSDLVLAAVADDPDAQPVVLPFAGMMSGPASLGPLQDRARERWASGWRPAYDPGPSRDELAEIVTSAARA